MELDESNARKDRLQREAADALREAAEKAFCDKELGESNAHEGKSQKDESQERGGAHLGDSFIPLVSPRQVN